MIFKNVGKILNKDTKTKVWWMKLAVAIIISNIFFFVLFAGNGEVKQVDASIPKGWVAMQLHAELLTPFQFGKKVLVIHRRGRKKLEGVLHTEVTEGMDKITILVKEDEAHALLQFESWEILPYLKNLNFASVRKEESHEIRY